MDTKRVLSASLGGEEKRPRCQIRLVEVPRLMTADVRHQIVTLIPRLRRLARALTGSADQADDLVLGACERALGAIDSWEPGSRLDSWMFRILRNLWIDQLRRRKAERITDAPDIEVAAPGEDGRRVTESRLELAHVRTVIATLPEEQREVLALVCIEDLSYREAAEVLQVPIGTVMSRLARARLALAAATGRARRANSDRPREQTFEAGPDHAARKVDVSLRADGASKAPGDFGQRKLVGVGTRPVAVESKE